MPPVHRKSAMRVVDGQVRRKNNWMLDRRDFIARRQDEIVLDRRDPGPGFRHVLTIAHLRAFLDLLPDWDEVAIGLDAIVLDHDPALLGWQSEGVVVLCSWERDLWWERPSERLMDDVRPVLDLIGVDYVRHAGGWQVRWTEDQIRAFQLVYVLAHELGHHHDQITTRGPDADRGEPYAEAYALRSMREVWPAYVRCFAV